MISFLGRLSGLTGRAMNPRDYMTVAAGCEWYLVAGVMLAMPWSEKAWKKVRNHWITDVFILVLFWIVVYYVATAAQDPFLYFQY